MRTNIGVRARTGPERWSNAAGTGSVRAHTGCYDDAIHTKHNEFWLIIHNLFGGLNPAGVKLFRLYKERAKPGNDRTEYAVSDSGASGVRAFAPHWSQLLSAAVVTGDAMRSLRAVDVCREDCLRASVNRVLAARAPPPPPPPPGM